MEERLSEDEMAFHDKVISDLKSAQAAWAAWSSHISMKYRLRPGEGIGEDGTVHRASEDSPPSDG